MTSSGGVLDGLRAFDFGPFGDEKGGKLVPLDDVRDALLSRIEELRDEPHTDWFLMGWNAALNRIECWATDTAAGGNAPSEVGTVVQLPTKEAEDASLVDEPVGGDTDRADDPLGGEPGDE